MIILIFIISDLFLIEMMIPTSNGGEFKVQLLRLKGDPPLPRGFAKSVLDYAIVITQGPSLFSPPLIVLPFFCFCDGERK